MLETRSVAATGDEGRGEHVPDARAHAELAPVRVGRVPLSVHAHTTPHEEAYPAAVVTQFVVDHFAAFAHHYVTFQWLNPAALTLDPQLVIVAVTQKLEQRQRLVLAISGALNVLFCIEAHVFQSHIEAFNVLAQREYCEL